MAALLSEIDIAALDSLQRFLSFVKEERNLLKIKLYRSEICQVTFDQLDLGWEKTYFETSHYIDQIQSGK